ncbi:protein-glutamine gamma-glutamyltransferase 2-like protein [Lates japonicus]|uniref:Protein-glutamine gamma-glutamyltransferase 2-like protein n=1 Tax=Lates japonicus TaxID=270547 RepID=A0AAD3M1U4_LATJO|nr:protein-glutamine gamma-glutamyltransferase 2-like protein [Lates japonicus]
MGPANQKLKSFTESTGEAQPVEGQHLELPCGGVLDEKIRPRAEFDVAVRCNLTPQEKSAVVLGLKWALTWLPLLQPGKKIEKRMSIMATSLGTKVLMATFSHSNSPAVISRSLHKVSVVAA